MNKIILFSLFFASSVPNILAQTLTEAKAWYESGDYRQALPVYKKLAEAQPANGTYRLHYGVCCLHEGQPAEALPHLEAAVRRRVQGGQYYLSYAYNDLYRFDEAIKTCEAYIAELEKRKRSTEQAERLLQKARNNLRLLKGVERVCIVDSFVVDKTDFLHAYRISPESGRLMMCRSYFNDSVSHGATVYQTERGNKLYYAELQTDSTLGLVSRNRLLDGWSSASPLSQSINTCRNADYPFASTDGLTLYFAADGQGSTGGYDIFVTRLSTDADTYLAPENVGMPFNSAYNDYMYAVDEFANLGWFASDRYQPEGKVCVYVFVPNTSKQVYDYENTPREQLIAFAQIRSIRDTWTDGTVVRAAQERLQQLSQDTQSVVLRPKPDFLFILDDQTIYRHADDFRSPRARTLHAEYLRKEEDFRQLTARLEQMRSDYADATLEKKKQISAALLNLEQQHRKLSAEQQQTLIRIRQIEKTNP